MSVGSQIKQRRTELGLSQEALAEKIGVSRSAISNWEIDRNYPDLQVIVKLSEVLGISIDELLKGDTVVVEKITTDTVQRKKLSKRLKVAYISVALLVLVVGLLLYKTRYTEISSAKHVDPVQYNGDNSFYVNLDIPFYRSYGGCYIDYSDYGETVNLTLITYRDLSMRHDTEEIINAYLYPNTKKVAIFYENEPLVTYELDDIDISKK